MTATDWLGQAVTVGRAETLAGIDAFVQGFLGYESRAVAVIAAAEADPESPLANAYAATLHILLEAPAGKPAARPFLERAEAAARAGTERERAFVAAIRAWFDGEVPAAIAAQEALLRRFPRDLIALKLCQLHCFNLGDSLGMLRAADSVGSENDAVPAMHGLRAFALEQCHLLEEAETAARRGIALKRKEPWCHHAVAHVLLTQGRTEEGIAFLRDVSETWTGLNSFMLTHNWWHLCLFLLDRDAFEEVLALYDTQVWGVWKEYSQDQIGAVSLLLRLELLGVEVGDRWRELGDYLAVRVDDHLQPFLDLQYLYGLGRAGRPEADALLASLQAFAPTAAPYVRPVWTEVAVPAARGLLAHARGDLETAVRELGLALPRLAEIGGSHAQRDLFEQVLLDALLRTGRWGAAQQRLALRNPAVPATRRALARVYAGAGLPGRAAAFGA